ncbi:MAG: hypothetical protein IKS41_02040 [Alphaproteobacteria bacterium]|nr:hypothetical protein [Alphaproteobacteria bacterium]
MRKSLFILATCLSISFNAFASGNIFCDNNPTSNPYCTTVAHIMYQGYLEGYANQMVQYQQQEGVEANKELAKLEAEKLISYDTLHKYFKECGESKTNINDAQSCILSNLQNYIMKKMGKKP